MSWEFIQREKLRISAWGSLKVAAWDLWAYLLDWFGIDAGPMPASWRQGT